MVYISPNDLIVDFLRHRLTDPRSRAETTEQDSFTASASQTAFQLTPSSGSLSAVTAVTVDAASKSKNKDYWVDTRNEKVTFHTAMSGGEAVVVTFKYGSSNWIYADKPQLSLSKTSYPRISVTTDGQSAERAGNYTADLISTIQFNISLFSKVPDSGDGIFTISSNKYEGESLIEYLVYQIYKAFKDNESDLHPALWNFKVVAGPKAMPFNYDLQLYETQLIIEMKGINMGEVDWI